MKMAKWIFVHNIGPQELRVALRRDCFRVASMATLGLSFATPFFTPANTRSEVTVFALLALWALLFPALWSALSAMWSVAWDASFKEKSMLRFAASPQQVSFSLAILCGIVVGLHAYAFIGVLSSGQDIGPAIAGLFFWIIPIYVFAVIIGLIFLYPVILFTTKIFLNAAPNWKPSAIAVQKRSTLDWLTLTGGLCTAIPFYAMFLVINRTEPYWHPILIFLRSLLWLGLALLVASAIWRIARRGLQLKNMLLRLIFRAKVDAPRSARH